MKNLNLSVVESLNAIMTDSGDQQVCINITPQYSMFETCHIPNDLHYFKKNVYQYFHRRKITEM